MLLNDNDFTNPGYDSESCVKLPRLSKVAKSKKRGLDLDLRLG